MFRQALSILTGSFVVAASVGVVFNQPSSAQTPGPFSCNLNNYTTVVNGNVVVSWRSEAFSASGYTPRQRCLEVSGRFNSFRSTGQLNYITAGIVNGLPVVCAASPGGSCNGGNVLFTLSRRNRLNVAEVMQTLFDNRAGAAGAVVQESSERVYIDVNKMLSSLGSSEPTASANPEPSETTQPNQPTPGGSW
ncbi:COP23 domain-containing protein [Anabaena sp. PCC 7108]|uniref:COP23 domain-containing protein n=1 Tax=Anabaena sp. PCC 7108 TaxID=163908 RepID=UPI000349098F|nr:COP23 domain-containing protein [Anabaena sp. PCC 7108]